MMTSSGRGEFVFRRAPLSMCKSGHAVASEWTALFVCAGKKLYLQGETPGYANLLKPPKPSIPKPKAYP